MIKHEDVIHTFKRHPWNEFAEANPTVWFGLIVVDLFQGQFTPLPLKPHFQIPPDRLTALCIWNITHPGVTIYNDVVVLDFPRMYVHMIQTLEGNFTVKDFGRALAVIMSVREHSADQELRQSIKRFVNTILSQFDNGQIRHESVTAAGVARMGKELMCQVFNSSPAAVYADTNRIIFANTTADEVLAAVDTCELARGFPISITTFESCTIKRLKQVEFSAADPYLDSVY